MSCVSASGTPSAWRMYGYNVDLSTKRIVLVLYRGTIAVSVKRDA